MPRPASAVWAHFRKDAATKRAECRYCQHSMSGLVMRMRSHLANKCPACPAQLRSAMLDADSRLDLPSATTTTTSSHSISTSSSTSISSSTSTSVSASTTSVAPKKPRRARLQLPPPAAPPTSISASIAAAAAATAVLLEDKHGDLDAYVAKAVFGAALPVAAVENAAFVRLLKRLQPGYEPPSAFTLATAALDLEYTEAQLKLRAEMLDASAVCMGVESWAKRAVVSCTIHTPSPGVFAFEATGELPHTPDLLAGKVESLMAQVGTAKISVVVLDTSLAMKQAGRALAAKYPDITFLPSCAHAMSAMVHEMLALSAITDALDVCRQLARFVTQNHVARAAFARVSEQMQTLDAAYPLAAESEDDASPTTRLECLFSVERNRHLFEIMLAENTALESLDEHIKGHILNPGFWEELSSYTTLLEPFLDMLKMFDADYPLLSTFYHRFTLLWSHLEKYGTLATKFQQIMSDHWQAIRHPAIYTAYLLDPRFTATNLTADAMSEVLTYLKRSVGASVFPSLVSELTRFTGRTGMFADEAIWESAQKCSPLHWWKGFIGSSCPSLQVVALRTLCFPATSGLPRSKRDMFDRILSMNAKFMSEEQASKAALVYLNANQSSPGVEDGVANETLV